jgi:hypothetical protein
LRRKAPVRNETDEERRDDGRNRRRAVDQPDLLAVEAERLPEIRPERDRPGASDEKFHEHHR